MTIKTGCGMQIFLSCSDSSSPSSPSSTLFSQSTLSFFAFFFLLSGSLLECSVTYTQGQRGNNKHNKHKSHLGGKKPGEEATECAFVSTLFFSLNSNVNKLFFFFFRHSSSSPSFPLFFCSFIMKNQLNKHRQRQHLLCIINIVERKLR